MRPLRIEVEGFSAYRERVEVDFRGVDFFSLAGPTGSGKSSLIDAMVFALFGRVPRLGGNAVAPAITAGTDRARVRSAWRNGHRAEEPVSEKPGCNETQRCWPKAPTTSPPG
jgi:exonuclease SbcC